MGASGEDARAGGRRVPRQLTEAAGLNSRIPRSPEGCRGRLWRRPGGRRLPDDSRCPPGGSAACSPWRRSRPRRGRLRGEHRARVLPQYTDDVSSIVYVNADGPGTPQTFNTTGAACRPRRARAGCQHDSTGLLFRRAGFESQAAHGLPARRRRVRRLSAVRESKPESQAGIPRRAPADRGRQRHERRGGLSLVDRRYRSVVRVRGRRTTDERALQDDRARSGCHREDIGDRQLHFTPEHPIRHHRGLGERAGKRRSIDHDQAAAHMPVQAQCPGLSPAWR